MTPSLLLEKIIEKAVRNGFVLVDHKHYVEIERKPDGGIKGITAYETIMFDHAFTKAFFGEEWPEDFSTVWGNRLPDIYWHYEIQQLALTPPEERLSYLAKYL